MFNIRRNSFDPNDVGKPQLTGAVGNNLGFWMTAFLGFQTLGAIYGIVPSKESSDYNKAILGPVRVTCLRGISKSGVIALIAVFFKIIRILPRKTLSAQSVVLYGPLLLSPSQNTAGLSFVQEMIK